MLFQNFWQDGLIYLFISLLAAEFVVTLGYYHQLAMPLQD